MRVERGDATAEVAILVPVVFLVLLLAVQCAAILHAGNVATAAAAQGAGAAAAHDAASIDGERAATLSVVELGATLIDKPMVLIDPQDARVSVTIKVPRILLGFPERITRMVTESRERFVGEGER